MTTRTHADPLHASDLIPGDFFGHVPFLDCDLCGVAAITNMPDHCGVEFEVDQDGTLYAGVAVVQGQRAEVEAEMLAAIRSGQRITIWAAKWPGQIQKGRQLLRGKWEILGGAR